MMINVETILFILFKFMQHSYKIIHNISVIMRSKMYTRDTVPCNNAKKKNKLEMDNITKKVNINLPFNNIVNCHDS